MKIGPSLVVLALLTLGVSVALGQPGERGKKSQREAPRAPSSPSDRSAMTAMETTTEAAQRGYVGILDAFAPET